MFFFQKNLICIFIVLGFFLLPIILYLRPENLAQTDYKEIVYLISSQLFLFFIFLFFSILFHKFFFKKKINFLNFLTLNSFIIFLLFFYKNFNLIFESLDFNQMFVIKGYKIAIVDNLIVILIYSIIYFLFFKLINKNQKKINYFLLSIIIINFLFFIINLLPDFYDSSKKNYSKLDKSDILLNLKDLKLKKNKNNNVFIFILDGMMNLERAENEFIINSSNEFISNLNKSGFKYLNDFKSNYSNTYLSIATVLTGNYPVTPNSQKYSNRKEFFPHMMMKTNNSFYKIIKKLNFNFFWIGNYWGPCKPNIYTNCLVSKKKLNLYFSNISKMYDNSIFRYFFLYYFKKNPSKNSYDIISNYEEFQNVFEENKKDNFFLIHMMKPHPPYNLDQNCNKLDSNNIKDYETRKKLYSNNYKCALKATLNWSDQFNKKFSNSNNMILILGDHGWNFNPNNLEFGEEDENFLSDRLDNVFFAYKSPDHCKNLKSPKTQVNIMKFIVNCLYDTNLEFLDDNQYVTRYETHSDYGKVYPY